MTAINNKIMLFWVMIVYAVLNYADIMVSRSLITNGGIERNPLMAPFVMTPWIFPVKAGLVLATLGLVYLLWIRYRSAAMPVLVAITVFMAVLVVTHLVVG